MRYLFKNVDNFAGFAHAINTYLAGVALAHHHNLSLIYWPFTAAHGLGFALEDFLAADPRGIVPPLATPRFGGSDAGLTLDGALVNLEKFSRSPNLNGVSDSERDQYSRHLEKRIEAFPDQTVVWVMQGRWTFAEPPSKTSNSSAYSHNAEMRYTGLWFRERFWQAMRGSVAAAERAAAGTERATKHGAAFTVAAAQPISIAVHLRRGDVTYLDKHGNPSHRWVEIWTVLEQLNSISATVGRPLAAPAIRVDIFSERKGWHANDTAAIRSLAPDAVIHLDSSASETIGALVGMAAADVLLLGASGFSTWAGLLSCGIKIGPAASLPLPFRHVIYYNMVGGPNARSKEPFAQSAAAADFGAKWTEYWGCKSDPGCAPTLCAPQRMDNAAPWIGSPLGAAEAANADGAQWQPTPLLPKDFKPYAAAELATAAHTRRVARRAAADGTATAAAADGSAGGSLEQIWRTCATAVAAAVAAAGGAAGGGGAARRHGRDRGATAWPCVRDTWRRNFSDWLGMRKQVKGCKGCASGQIWPSPPERPAAAGAAGAAAGAAVARGKRMSAIAAGAGAAGGKKGGLSPKLLAHETRKQREHLHSGSAQRRNGTAATAEGGSTAQVALKARGGGVDSLGGGARAGGAGGAGLLRGQQRLERELKREEVLAGGAKGGKKAREEGLSAGAKPGGKKARAHPPSVIARPQQLTRGGAKGHNGAGAMGGGAAARAAGAAAASVGGGADKGGERDVVVSGQFYGMLD